jgi:hypothetical protein
MFRVKNLVMDSNFILLNWLLQAIFQESIKLSSFLKRCEVQQVFILFITCSTLKVSDMQMLLFIDIELQKKFV